MSIPTFNGKNLCSKAGRQTIGSRQVRVQMETMPGANGAFVQGHGYGARTITVRGVLEGNNCTAALAYQTVMAAFRDIEATADGDTVATYVGTDGQSYTNCMLQSYNWTQTPQVSEGPTYYRAIGLIEAVLVQLTP